MNVFVVLFGRWMIGWKAFVSGRFSWIPSVGWRIWHLLTSTIDSAKGSVRRVFSEYLESKLFFGVEGLWYIQRFSCSLYLLCFSMLPYSKIQKHRNYMKILVYTKAPQKTTSIPGIRRPPVLNCGAFWMNDLMMLICTLDSKQKTPLG